MNMMNVSDISESLGFKVTTEFIVNTLGIKPDDKDKRATLFAESKFEDIQEALIKHIGSCLPSKAPKRPSKAEAKKADPAPADDEDY